MKQTPKDKFQVGVKTFIVNKKGKILILKRDQKLYKTVNNLWDIPGGRILKGKTLLDNLKREVFEETGIKSLNVLGILGAQDIIKLGRHIVRITYISRVTSPRVLLSKEHTEFGWLSLPDLLRIGGLDRHTKELIKDKKIMSFIININRK